MVDKNEIELDDVSKEGKDSKLKNQIEKENIDFQNKQKDLRDKIFAMRARRVALEGLQQDIDSKIEGKVAEGYNDFQREALRFDELLEKIRGEGFQAYQEWATCMMNLLKCYMQLNKTINALVNAHVKGAVWPKLKEKVILPIMHSFASQDGFPGFEYKLNIDENGKIDPELYIGGELIEKEGADLIAKDMYNSFEDAFTLWLDTQGYKAQMAPQKDEEGKPLKNANGEFILKRTGVFVNKEDENVVLTQDVVDHAMEKENSFDDLLGKRFLLDHHFHQQPSIKC